MKIEKILDSLGSFLQEISDYRDKVLLLFIKPYWPRKISPNQITYVRVAIGLFLFILLFFFGIADKLLVVSLFFVGILTDLLDGSVARGLNKVTEFGAMLDPIADRFLILPIAIYSLYRSHWILLIIWLLTEVVNALISMFYKSKEPYIESNIFGKTKMALLALVFLAILIVWPKTPSLFFIDIIWLCIIISFLSIFTKLLSLKDKGHIKNKFINKEI